MSSNIDRRNGAETTTLARPLAAAGSGNNNNILVGVENKNQPTKLPAGVHKNGWFTESDTLWPGQKLSLALEEFSASKSVLYSNESPYQSILVVQTARYGKVLVLDGVIQLTEKDEFAFHEMLVHIPVCCARPQTTTTTTTTIQSPHLRVLIIGGGDGAALFHLCRYDASIVQKVTVVEIDPLVVQVVQTHFPHFAQAFDDPRVDVIYQDGAEFLQATTTETYDIILGDTLDPVGPAESLFQPQFYERMEEVLTESGMIVVQAECYWIQLDLISDVYACCHDLFDYVHYATTHVPSYPTGQIGFLVAGKISPRQKRQQRLNRWRNIFSRRSDGGSEYAEDDFYDDDDDDDAVAMRGMVRQPIRECGFPTRYYSPEMHRAAFALPPFVWEHLTKKCPSSSYMASRNGNSNSDDEENATDCCLTNINPPGCVVL